MGYFPFVICTIIINIYHFSREFFSTFKVGNNVSPFFEKECMCLAVSFNSIYNPMFSCFVFLPFFSFFFLVFSSFSFLLLLESMNCTLYENIASTKEKYSFRKEELYTFQRIYFMLMKRIVPVEVYISTKFFLFLCNTKSLETIINYITNRRYVVFLNSRD